MTDLKCGTVKFFDANKGFGFITVDEKDGVPQEDVFFRIEQGSFYIQELHGNYGMLETYPTVGKERTPLKGERVNFYCRQRSRGPVATIWCFEDDWKHAQEIVAARPKYDNPRCAVVANESTPRPKVFWEGWLNEVAIELGCDPSLLPEDGTRKVQISLTQGWTDVNQDNPARSDQMWWWPRPKKSIAA